SLSPIMSGGRASFLILPAGVIQPRPSRQSQGRPPDPHWAVLTLSMASWDLVVQRNALSGLPQWLPPEPLAPFLSPRAGVALTRPSIPRLPPGGDVQVALQRIAGRLRGQEHLQQPPHVRQRDAVGCFFPPTAASPASGTTTPASPASCDGASPT